MKNSIDEKDILKNIPASGFTKLTGNRADNLKKSDRVSLNRKGNQFFNEGKVDLARRIFLTTGYSDGLIRLGDYYYKNSNYIEAYKMYVLAPDPGKKELMLEKISNIVKNWLD